VQKFSVTLHEKDRAGEIAHMAQTAVSVFAATAHHFGVWMELPDPSLEWGIPVKSKWDFIGMKEDVPPKPGCPTRPSAEETR
jgi:hypothetical protein